MPAGHDFKSVQHPHTGELVSGLQPLQLTYVIFGKKKFNAKGKSHLWTERKTKRHQWTVKGTA